LDSDESENVVFELGIDLPVGSAAAGVWSASLAPETLGFEWEAQRAED